jgi:hypothetical protein
VRCIISSSPGGRRRPIARVAREGGRGCGNRGAYACGLRSEGFQVMTVIINVVGI